MRVTDVHSFMAPDGGGAGGGAGNSGGGASDGGAASGGGGATGGAAGGAGGGDKPFYADYGLDAAHTDFVIGKGFKTPGDLVKSAMLSDRLVRERNVVAAPDMAKLDAWEGWEKLGWHPEFGQYKVAEAKIPQGLEYNKTMEGTLLKAMHEARVPPHQAGAVRDALIGMLKSEVDARTASGAAELEGLRNGLKAKWGADYDARTDLAGRAARALNVDLATSAELEKFMGAPRLLEHFAAIGEKLGEDVLRGGSARAAPSMTPDAAAAEQRKLTADSEFMKSLADPRHPLHKDNSQRWQRLIQAKVEGRR